MNGWEAIQAMNEGKTVQIRYRDADWVYFRKDGEFLQYLKNVGPLSAFRVLLMISSLKILTTTGK